MGVESDSVALGLEEARSLYKLIVNIIPSFTLSTDDGGVFRVARKVVERGKTWGGHLAPWKREIS